MTCDQCGTTSKAKSGDTGWLSVSRTSGGKKSAHQVFCGDQCAMEHYVAVAHAMRPLVANPASDDWPTATCPDCGQEVAAQVVRVPSSLDPDAVVPGAFVCSCVPETVAS